jgi:hypothetical protein
MAQRDSLKLNTSVLPKISIERQLENLSNQAAPTFRENKTVVEVEETPQAETFVKLYDSFNESVTANMKFFVPATESKNAQYEMYFVPRTLEYKPMDWVLPILLLCLGIITVLKSFNLKKIQLYFSAFITNRFINQIIREEKFLFGFTSIGLMLNSVLGLGLFLYFVIDYFSNSTADFAFWLILAISIGFFGLRIIMFKISEFILGRQEALSEYLLNQLTTNYTLGLVLIPINFCLYYLQVEQIQYLMLASFVIVLVVLSIGYIKTTYLGLFKYSYSLLYIIFYICTLEFIPLLIMSKYILREMG